MLAATSPRADADLRIQYQSAPVGQLSAFEVSALVRQLRRSRRPGRGRCAPATPAPYQATPRPDDDVPLDRSRVAGPKAALDALGADITSFLTTLAAMLTDPVANRAATILAQVDALAPGAAGLLQRAARFGLPQSGWGFAHEWRRSTLAGLLPR